MKADLAELKNITGAYKASANEEDDFMERLEEEGDVDIMRVLADN